MRKRVWLYNIFWTSYESLALFCKFRNIQFEIMCKDKIIDILSCHRTILSGLPRRSWRENSFVSKEYTNVFFFPRYVDDFDYLPPNKIIIILFSSCHHQLIIAVHAKTKATSYCIYLLQQVSVIFTLIWNHCNYSYARWKERSRYPVVSHSLKNIYIPVLHKISTIVPSLLFMCNIF